MIMMNNKELKTTHTKIKEEETFIS